MRVLVAGLNYAPELVGIGPYTTDLARSLAARGHRVHVVSGQPYYPAWQVPADYRRRTAVTAVEHGVTVTRCPLYVPARPTGAKRLLHHASFLASSGIALRRVARRMRPDVVFAVAPSLIAAPAALAVARLAGARSWLHIQDFELEAAQATGLVGGGAITGRAGAAFERGLMQRFDRVSSISPQMCDRLRSKGVGRARIVELRNGADVDAVRRLDVSAYRERWGIATPHVALYSGNLANKQGVEILVETARALAPRGDVTIVICGDGPKRTELIASAQGLPNIRFCELQPRDQLSELLALATVHLLPQRAEAADLVLPSKLGNMLASGRPVVATAAPETGVADEVADCGLITPPGDALEFARGIARLLDDSALAARLGAAARRRAEGRWGSGAIMAGLERELLCLTDEPR